MQSELCHPQVVVMVDSIVPPLPARASVRGIEHLLSLDTLTNGTRKLVSVDVSGINTASADSILPRIDVVCVADVSASMSWSIQGPHVAPTKGARKIDLLKYAVKEMAQRLYMVYSGADRTALVTFDRHSRQVTPLMLTIEAEVWPFYKATDTITAGNGTNIMAGLHHAVSILVNRRQVNQRCAIVLLTDGKNSSSIPISKGECDDFRRVADSIGCSVFTMGIGADHDAPFLQSLTQNGGVYAYLSDHDAIRNSIVTASNIMKTIAVENCLLRVFSGNPDSLSNIEAGNYPVKRTVYGFDVTFGDLMFSENRTVIFEEGPGPGFFAFVDADVLATNIHGQVKSLVAPRADTEGKIQRELARFVTFNAIKEAVAMPNKGRAIGLLWRTVYRVQDLAMNAPDRTRSFFYALDNDIRVCVVKLEMELEGKKTDLVMFATDVANANLNRRAITQNHSESTVSLSSEMKKMWLQEDEEPMK